MNSNNNIPKSWINTTLGEVSKSIKGKKPKLLSDTNSNEINIPYIDIKAFEKKIISNWTDGNSCNLCEKDDILMVWDGARCGLIGNGAKGAIGSTLAKFETYQINKPFFYYFLKSKYNYLNTNSKGIGIPHIEPNILWNLNFNLPPLNEQHRIVEKLEELLTQLDISVEELKKAKKQIKTYKQSVLKSAFTGKLTNENIKIDKTNGLPIGWEWVHFNDISIKIGDVDHKMPKVSDSGLPYISTKDLSKDLKINFKTAKLISESDFKLLSKKIKPEKDDIIFPRYGTIGRNVLVVDESDFLVSYSCAIIKLNKNKVLPKYAHFYSISPVIIGEIDKYTVQTTQANIGIASIKLFIFPLCNLQLQEQIVLEIETRFSQAENLEKTIDIALKQAESLRQSILKKAFEGRLVPQDTNDEPASVLLERIKKEKNDVTKTKKGKK